MNAISTSNVNLQQARVAAPKAAPEPSQAEFAAEPQDQVQKGVEDALKGLMAGPSRAPQVEQFADSAGRVKHLALLFSNYVNDEDGSRPQVLNAYKTLFTKMEPDTKFTVVVAEDKDKADLQKLISDNHIDNPERIQILEPGVPNLTCWGRDMMVPEFKPGQPGQTALVAQQPLHNWHLDDSKVPAFITAANPNIELMNRPAIITDGGDTQANTKESFVGYYSLAATENQLHNGLHNSAVKNDVIHWYEGQKHVNVVETPFNETFPFRFVPFTAADGTAITRMEANPDYKPVALAQGQVSDAQMYDDLSVQLFQSQWGKPVTIMGRDNPATQHHEEPATDHMDMGCTPIDDHTFLVGDPSLYGPPSRNRDCQADFDAYAKTLTDKGYNVFRVPHHEPQQNGDPYISYNNCLMERFEKDGKEVRRVFLPVYGQPSDDVAIKTWQSQNYEVIPMPLDKLSAKWGALRCISNWLDRSPAA